MVYLIFNSSHNVKRITDSFIKHVQYTKHNHSNEWPYVLIAGWCLPHPCAVLSSHRRGKTNCPHTDKGVFTCYSPYMHHTFASEFSIMFMFSTQNFLFLHLATCQYLRQRMHQPWVDLIFDYSFFYQCHDTDEELFGVLQFNCRVPPWARTPGESEESRQAHWPGVLQQGTVGCRVHHGPAGRGE